MSNSIFIKPPEYYQRKLNPIEDYIEQTAYYLHTVTNDPLPQCIEFVKNELANPTIKPLVNPNVQYFERQENGDREFKQTTLSNYINSVNKDNLIIAPSFTCYLHPSVERSDQSEYVVENVKERNIAKDAAYVYKAKKNIDMFSISWNEQTNRKLTNNALSGSYATVGFILNNPSAHSTLTSTTRTITSFGNSSNERFIAGNRHYWSPDTVINNIISIISNTDYSLLVATMDEYNFYYPTVEDVMECINYSSSFYWNDYRRLNDIREFVNSLLMTQRAAFVYSGDFYHFRKHNPDFVFNFITELSTKCFNIVADPLTQIKDLTEAELNLAHHICFNDVRGKGTDYNSMANDGTLNKLIPTCLNVRAVLEKYRDIIETFFVVDNLPPSVAHIKHMVRRRVVLSDTDSTCASYNEWVDWYFNKKEHRQLSLRPITEETIGVAASVMILSTQSIAHYLAIFSANANVEKSNLFKLAMKNEFTWSVFCPTNVAKHYFAKTIVQETNVYNDNDGDSNYLEIKGAHLKNSSSNKDIIKDANLLMTEICTTIANGTSISLIACLTRVANVEKLISSSLLSGKIDYYRVSIIKEAAAYVKDQEESPYQHYLLWKNIFAEKYGEIEEPPYSVIKVPTILRNKTQLAKWLASIEDQELASRLTEWCIKYKKQYIPTLYLPLDYIKGNGMVAEIIPIIDTKRIILDLCNVYYIVLETLSFYKKINYTLTELGY